MAHALLDCHACVMPGCCNLSRREVLRWGAIVAATPLLPRSIPTFDMNQTQARELERMYARTPGVFFQHSGHTHRNKRTHASGVPNVVFQEVSAVKEYPGGFTLLRVFTGGYLLQLLQVP
jgi:hypothetical protein